MVHLILTGATGLVGGSVLSHILSLPASTTISRLSILSRSPVPLASKLDRKNTTTQIEVINHKDYTTYPPELLEKLKGADGVIWAQGISQSEVDKDTYVKITKDYPIAAAKAFAKLNGPGIFTFVYVSGEMVTHSAKWYTPIFSRVKGEAEQELMALAKDAQYAQTLRIYNARPGGVDGRKQPEVWEPTYARRSFGWKVLMHTLLPFYTAFFQRQLSPTPELGKVLTELAMGDGEPLTGSDIESGGRVVRNLALRRFGGLSH